MFDRSLEQPAVRAGRKQRNRNPIVMTVHQPEPSMNTPRTTPTRQLLILGHNLALRFTTTILLAALGWLTFSSQPARATQLVLQMDIHQTGSAAGGNLSR